MARSLHAPLSIAALALASAAQESAAHDPAPPAREPSFAFAENLGQWSHPARYVASLGATSVLVEERGWTLAIREVLRAEAGASVSRAEVVAREAPLATLGVAVRMSFEGAGAAELVPEDARAGCHHYFLGNDPSRWRSHVPLYGAVRLRAIESGIDVRLREQGGLLEYDLLLAPEADLEQVAVRVEGADGLRLEPDGALAIETPLGPVRQAAPRTWEVAPDGEASPVECSFVLLGPQHFGFLAPGRRPESALCIDPGLVYSSYLGSGAPYDRVFDLALDATGAVLAAGETHGAFPTTPGAFDESPGGFLDGFVARLAPGGASLEYATFLGGTGTSTEAIHAIALDGQGVATVVGQTTSADFPTTPGAFDTSFNGGFGGDAFVARLSADGSALLYGTFLGGTQYDLAEDASLSDGGAVTVVGRTQSPDFPTTPGAFDVTHAGGEYGDAYAARLDPTGSALIYSTLLGGGASDLGLGVATGADGTATVVGTTESPDFPTTPGAFDEGMSGLHGDAFVTRVSADGASLVYSTFLGGSAGVGGQDSAIDVALDASGNATVVGNTVCMDFPTTPGAYDPVHVLGGTFGFVTRVAPDGAGLVYSTYLGGGSNDTIDAVALDSSGAATVAGRTGSGTFFPVTPGAFDVAAGATDAFVARLSATGAKLVYSTFLGGSDIDGATAVAVDAGGQAVVGGETSSPDFPATAGAFDTTYGGGFSDGFVTRLDMLPTGVTAYGSATAGCGGPPAIGVNSWPKVGNAEFAVTCIQAPPLGLGALGVSSAPLPLPFPLLGFELWIDPLASGLRTFPAAANPLGAAEVPIPIPADPLLAGARVFAQFAWFDACGPQGFSASHALRISVQP